MSTYITECKVWRNSMNLFRGAEYQRYVEVTSKEPLTYYDMNLSAQDHQTFFSCECDVAKPEYESMYCVLFVFQYECELRYITLHLYITVP